MKSVAQRSWQALRFKANFAHPCWKLTQNEARIWLIAACVADLAAQAFVGDPSWITLLCGLVLPAILWNIPARLSAGVGAVLTTQAAGSVLVILAGHGVRLPRIAVEVLALGWWAYCIAALVAMAMVYARTPRSSMA